MEVVDRCLKCLHTRNIAIVSRTLLPEAEATLARSFTDGEPLQERTASGREQSLDLRGIGPFEPRNNRSICGCGKRGLTNRWRCSHHVHKRHQLERQLATCPVAVRRQSLSQITLIQQWQALIAGERQFMEVAWFVIMRNGLSLTAAACISPRLLEDALACRTGGCPGVPEMSLDWDNHQTAPKSLAAWKNIGRNPSGAWQRYAGKQLRTGSARRRAFAALLDVTGLAQPDYMKEGVSR